MLRWTTTDSRWGVRTLDPVDLGAARSLLYDVYYGEQRWSPGPNPSGVTLRHDEQAGYHDDFDDDAVWVGAFAAGELVGVARCLHRELEVGRYVALPEGLANGAIEINRLAVRRRSRHGTALPLLFCALAWLVWRLGARRVLAAPQPAVRRLLVHLGFTPTGIHVPYAEDRARPLPLISLPGTPSALVGAVWGIARARRRPRPKRYANSAIAS